MKIISIILAAICFVVCASYASAQNYRIIGVYKISENADFVERISISPNGEKVAYVINVGGKLNEYNSVEGGKFSVWINNKKMSPEAEWVLVILVISFIVGGICSFFENRERKKEGELYANNPHLRELDRIRQGLPPESGIPLGSWKCPNCSQMFNLTPKIWMMRELDHLAINAESESCPNCGNEIDTEELVEGRYDSD